MPRERVRGGGVRPILESQAIARHPAAELAEKKPFIRAATVPLNSRQTALAAGKNQSTGAGIRKALIRARDARRSRT